jgi:hypothetical protein
MTCPKFCKGTLPTENQKAQGRPGARGGASRAFDPSQPDATGCRPSCVRPVSAGPTNAQAAEGHMTVAQQAFIFTGEIFVLSFVAIYAVWFADRLLRNFLR